ncbi:hypothetical protein Hanom_Chr06g00493401 [Helianthus anomalus]
MSYARCVAREKSRSNTFIPHALLPQKVSSWCCVPNIVPFSFRDLLDLHNSSGLME